MSILENGTPAPSKASATILAILLPTPTLTLCSPAPPLPEQKKPLRNSWVFRYMPDENI
jgi:hypothetical protein